MKKLFIFLFPIAICIGCKEKTKTSPSHEGEVFVKVRSVKVPNGWGYEVVSDTNVFIKQYFIPSISGQRPFKSEDDALKTGQLVLEKLKENKLPSLDSMDLVRLGVL